MTPYAITGAVLGACVGVAGVAAAAALTLRATGPGVPPATGVIVECEPCAPTPTVTETVTVTEAPPSPAAESSGPSQAPTVSPTPTASPSPSPTPSEVN